MGKVLKDDHVLGITGSGGFSFMLSLCSSLCLLYVQRIKKPELRLQDFAGLDMVKDEINYLSTRSLNIQGHGCTTTSGKHSL